MKTNIKRNPDDHFEFSKVIMVDEALYKKYEKTNKTYIQLQNSFWKRFCFLFTGV